jgi:hypothetical protein
LIAALAATRKLCAQQRKPAIDLSQPTGGARR